MSVSLYTVILSCSYFKIFTGAKKKAYVEPFTISKQRQLCMHCDNIRMPCAFYQWALALFNVHKHRRHGIMSQSSGGKPWCPPSRTSILLALRASSWRRLWRGLFLALTSLYWPKYQFKTHFNAKIAYRPQKEIILLYLLFNMEITDVCCGEKYKSQLYWCLSLNLMLIYWVRCRHAVPTYSCLSFLVVWNLKVSFCMLAPFPP